MMNKVINSFLRQSHRSYSSIAAAAIQKPMAGGDLIAVDFEANTGIATMFLNKPPANDMDVDMLDEATNAIKDAQKNSRVKGIILTSILDWGVFTHGINIMDVYKSNKRNDSYLSELWDHFHDWFVAWYGCDKPVVAAINGNASSTGCIWALMCDYRVMLADRKTKIGINDTQMGIAPAPFVVDLVRSVSGSRHAEEITLGGRLLDAEDALRTGLVNEITPKDYLVARARHQLQQLIEIPPEAYGATKLRLREPLLRNITAKKESDPEYYQQPLTHLS